MSNLRSTRRNTALLVLANTPPALPATAAKQGLTLVLFSAQLIFLRGMKWDKLIGSREKRLNVIS